MHRPASGDQGAAGTEPPRLVDLAGSVLLHILARFSAAELPRFLTRCCVKVCFCQLVVCMGEWVRENELVNYDTSSWSGEAEESDASEGEWEEIMHRGA
jgi:hypothetical protein